MYLCVYRQQAYYLYFFFRFTDNLWLQHAPVKLQQNILSYEWHEFNKGFHHIKEDAIEGVFVHGFKQQ